MPEKKQEHPTQARMRIHLMVEDAEKGGVVSDPGKGTLAGRNGKPTRWRFACRPSGTPCALTDIDRGTGEPWAVRCDACKATADFKAIDRPRPGQGRSAAQMEATGEEGCCG